MEPPSLFTELRKLLLWLTLACFSRKLVQKQIDCTSRIDSFSQKRSKWAWFPPKWAWLQKFTRNCTIGTPLQRILDPPLDTKESILFPLLGLLSQRCSKKYDSAFIKEGFCNWKKARERFERHEKSESHKEAVLKLKSMQAPSVIAQLSTHACRDQAEHRSMLLKQLHSLRYLLRQGLPIRGHKESEGELIQILRMQSIDCPRLRQWVSESFIIIIMTL